ncbi:MAG: hypothetical protein RLZZ246_547 [Planctomycetota bacterium]
MQSTRAFGGAGPSAVQPGTIIGDTLDLLASTTPLRTWFVARHRADEHIVLHVAGRSGDAIAPGQVYRAPETPCSEVVRCGRCITFDPSMGSGNGSAHALMQDAGCTTYTGVPLLWAPEDAGVECFGTLAGLDCGVDAASMAAHRRVIDHAAAVIGFALQAGHDADQLRRRAERAENESTVDHLTRLYNRRGWQAIADAEAGRIQRYGSAAGVVMIDLDELKRTNDAYGHRAGDALLRHAAQIIRGAFRDSDVIARLGGDEFAVLLLESDATTTRWAAARAQESLAVAGVQASVGWATLDAGRDIDAALHDEDAAMYASKCARRQFGQGPDAPRPRCA